ncbi:AfsA-related hotdog domain-containing protein [Amycolatopsis halotolerans]|uniref:AfsA-related hotdog domain-containing protein n=1 Tax=Amycolatopsis halotolerans TaxID=330083 RepID=A0ABV7QMM3_9PSEU
MTAFVVVGDRFAKFAANTGAVTVSQLIEKVHGGGMSGAVKLVGGQGVTESDWDRIRAALARREILSEFETHPLRHGPLSDRSETHKHNRHNILVAGLEQVGEHEFEAALRLHNDQEFQLDHMGVHVQGMIVLEAARQMYLAVCERYYPREDEIHLFDKMETAFRNFLYPLETRLRTAVTAGTSDLGRPVFDVRTEFRQAGLHIAAVRTVGTALSAQSLERKEHRGAERALRHALKNSPAPDPAR